MSRSRVQKYLADWRSLPADTVGAWRVGGASAVWLELRRRTLDRAGGYSRGLVLELDLTRIVDIAPPAGVVVARFAGPDWSSLGEMVGGRLAAKFARIAGAGRCCFLARRGAETDGYTWISTVTEPRYEGYDLPLPSDAIYAWGVQVARRQRGLGIGSALVSYALRHARAEGYRRAWAVIHPENIASLRTFAAVGPGHVVGTVARLKLLSSMRCRYHALPASYSVQEALNA